MIGCLLATGSLAALALAAPPAPDRGDLGAAYLRFERAVAAAPKDPATRRRANLAFDALTGDFFAGRFGRALEKLAEIEGGLDGDVDGDVEANVEADLEASLEGADRRFLAAHRFTIEPRLAAAADLRAIRVRAETLAGMAADSRPSAILIRQGDRSIEADAADLLGVGRVIEVDPPLGPGPVEVLVEMRALGGVPVGRAFLFEDDPTSIRDRLAQRIEDAAAADGSDPSTIASLRARHELAFGAFERAKSADLLADPIEIARELEAEIAQALAGERPYAVPGDTWRVVRAAGLDLPVRQYVPEGVGPFPLIVAFHGAGGDENLFFEGYGAGRLLAVARSRGVAVVCPPTIPFGLSPNVLAKFLEELAKEVPFDPTRVGLVGHSLGAATASRLAVLRPDAIVGCVAIAGFADLARSGRAAPRRIYLAELDPLFPLEATRASIEAARARGDAGLEVVVVPHEGHTLVVGEVIDQAVDWLLALAPRRAANAPPTQSAPSTPPMKTDGPPPSAPTTSPMPGPTK